MFYPAYLAQVKQLKNLAKYKHSYARQFVPLYKGTPPIVVTLGYAQSYTLRLYTYGTLTRYLPIQVNHTYP